MQISSTSSPARSEAAINCSRATREWHGGHFRKVISPQAIEVILFIVDTGSFSITARFTKTSTDSRLPSSETKPGFVHGP